MVANVYPPKQVALVGAGNGAGPLVQWLQSWASDKGGGGVPAVTLLEPQLTCRTQLAKGLARKKYCVNWQLLPDLLAPAQGEHMFYQYSLAAENSLLPLEVLRPLWPGLALQSESSIESVELSTLLPASWLLVDCLPSADLLQSTRLPASTHVVLARVLLTNEAPIGTSLIGVQEVLKDSGFKAVAVFAERNSAIGKVLLVRDPNELQGNIDRLQQEKEQVQKRCDELAKAKEAETAAKQAEVQARAAEHKAKEQALEKSKYLEADKAQLIEAKDKALVKIKLMQQSGEQASQQLVELNRKLAETEKELSKTQKAVSILEQKNISNEKLIISLKANFEPAGGLGEMIKDLEPFFYGRRLTYVDIGAYVGDVYLKFASSNLKIREAHLFEPNPHTYQELVEKTFVTAKSISIHHYQMALGSSDESLRIRLAASMSKVTECNVTDVLSNANLESATIPATTLDKFIDNITDKQIHILKIDVEGFEESVLRGATETLKNQHVDVLIIEVGFNPLGTQQSYYTGIDHLLVNFNYRLFKIYEQVYEWISDSPLLRRANFVYMSEKFAKSNPYRVTHELQRAYIQIKEIKQKINDAQPKNKV
jgi:FkbM family methyltransferase